MFGFGEWHPGAWSGSKAAALLVLLQADGPFLEQPCCAEAVKVPGGSRLRTAIKVPRMLLAYRQYEETCSPPPLIQRRQLSWVLRGCPTGQQAPCGGGKWSGEFLRLPGWTGLSSLTRQLMRAYMSLCWTTVITAGCLSWRPSAWMIFKSDGDSLSRSWPCIYSERSLVVCGKELGPGAEATTSRTKPQNLHNCQGLPTCLPSWRFVSPHICYFSVCSCHCSLREESILFNRAMLSGFNFISCHWFVTTQCIHAFVQYQ